MQGSIPSIHATLPSDRGRGRACLHRKTTSYGEKHTMGYPRTILSPVTTKAEGVTDGKG
jgi:hypothetical protein